MRDRWDDLTREEAREWAVRYLRTELERRAPDRVLEFVGYRGGPDEPGVQFDRGHIVIAGRFPPGKLYISHTRELLGHHFRVADLLPEASGQMSLFEGGGAVASPPGKGAKHPLETRSSDVRRGSDHEGSASSHCAGDGYAMRKRRRNPRRVVKDVTQRCYQYGSAIVSTWRCILSCGHEVEGYPDTLDGRKACPECGRGESDA